MKKRKMDNKSPQVGSASKGQSSGSSASTAAGFEHFEKANSASTNLLGIRFGQEVSDSDLRKWTFGQFDEKRPSVTVLPEMCAKTNNRMHVI